MSAMLTKVHKTGFASPAFQMNVRPKPTDVAAMIVYHYMIVIRLATHPCIACSNVGTMHEGMVNLLPRVNAHWCLSDMLSVIRVGKQSRRKQQPSGVLV